MLKVLIPLADGVEEIEAVTAVDVFRRVPWQVTAAGLRPGLVTAARGVRLAPDADWSAINPATFDLLVIPGGGQGTATLAADIRVLEAVRLFMRAGKAVAAICAGPLVLQAAGVLHGRQVTAYPGIALEGVRPVAGRVVVDGRLITSQGPGTALEFALAIVRALAGPARADQLARELVAAAG